MGYYRDKSRSVITEAILEGKRQRLTGAELEKFVSDRYPFQTTKGLPGEMWLQEYDHLVRRPNRAKKGRGQGEFFKGGPG